jgi:tetratricopeptide (TPR) repeat protein
MNLIPVEAMLAKRLKRASKEDLVQMALGLGRYSLLLLRSRSEEQLRAFLAEELPRKAEIQASSRGAFPSEPEAGAADRADKTIGVAIVSEGTLRGMSKAVPPPREHEEGRKKMMKEAEVMSLQMTIPDLERELEALRTRTVEPAGEPGPAPAEQGAAIEEVKGELVHRFLRLAALETDLGRDEASIRTYQKALCLVGDEAQRALILGQIGSCYEGIGDFQHAEEAYRGSLASEAASEDLRYWSNNNLAYCLNVVGRYQEAEAYCRAALALRPERHNAHKNLGLALQGQGRLLQAARSFIRAVGLFPLDSRALRHLETLLGDHSELFDEAPDLRSELERCRRML